MQKKFSMSLTAKKKKSNRLENTKNCSSNKNNQEEDLIQKKKVQSQKSMRAKRRQTKTRVEKPGLSIDDMKKLENLYLKGPASFGNAEGLHILHQISFTSPQISKA